MVYLISRVLWCVNGLGKKFYSPRQKKKTNPTPLIYSLCDCSAVFTCDKKRIYNCGHPPPAIKKSLAQIALLLKAPLHSPGGAVFNWIYLKNGGARCAFLPLYIPPPYLGGASSHLNASVSQRSSPVRCYAVNRFTLAVFSLSCKGTLNGTDVKK